jgi:NADH dehydrogenase FAD-containing subunit
MSANSNACASGVVSLRIAFEQAEAEEGPSRLRDPLTFVLVGAGPTGLEMAGAIAVLIRNTLQSEFQVAMQQGRYAGVRIHRRVAGRSAPGPFRYFDNGNMAVHDRSSS